MSDSFKKAALSLLSRNVPVMVCGCQISTVDAGSNLMVKTPDATMLATDLDDALNLIQIWLMP